MYRCSKNFTNISLTLFVKYKSKNLYHLTQRRTFSGINDLIALASSKIKKFWSNDDNIKISAVVLVGLLFGKSYYDTYEEISQTIFFNHILKNNRVDCLYSTDKFIQVNIENERLFDTKYWFHAEPSEFTKLLLKSDYENIPIYPKILTLQTAYNILWFLILIPLVQAVSSRFKKNNKAVTNLNNKFKDIVGCEEAKLEVLEFVKFLKDPKQYTDLGAKLPTGAILHGPPGTGKTLMAKAIAGEAGVPFLSMAGSEFMEIYLGEGARRVRELFESAKEQSPCIVFIDEIDSIGTKRTEVSNTEVTSTLNQLLAEMDGMNSLDNVIVFAATNMLEMLDSALLRPGRFDRQIYVSLPDIKGRLALFEVYLADIKTDPSIDKTEIARYLANRTTGFSGADVSNLCNEAAIIATRHNCDSVTMSHFSSAIDRVVAGLENKNRVMSKRHRNIIAHHEAGHAVAGWFLEHADPVMKISIVPRGKAHGFVLYLPTERRYSNNSIFFDSMCVSLGGRVAESIFFNHLTSGASDDLKQVTDIAYYQMMSLGYSQKVGHVSFDRKKRTQLYSESTGECIDAEVKRIVDEAYARTEKLLLEKKDLVEKLALLLLEKEVLEREDIELVLGKRPFKEMLTYKDAVDDTDSRSRSVKSVSFGLSVGGQKNSNL